MEIRAKHIVLGLGIITLLGYYVSKKVASWKRLLPLMQAYPTKLKNIRPKFSNSIFPDLLLDLDITIFNPTTEVFDPNGIVANLDRVEIFAKNIVKPIGTLKINESMLNIPANGSTVLENKTFTIPVNLGLVNIVKNIRSIDDLSVNVIIIILGKEYTI